MDDDEVGAKIAVGLAELLNRWAAGVFSELDATDQAKVEALVKQLTATMTTTKPRVGVTAIIMLAGSLIQVIADTATSDGIVH